MNQAKDGELFIYKSDNNIVMWENRYGVNCELLIKECLGIPVHPPSIEKRIDRFYTRLESCNLGCEDREKEVDWCKNELLELEKLIPNEPKLTGMRVLMKRKELLGK
jgi:hypothetical protein